ncbi:uncharacterized protein LOC128231995 [Mya arenaria]|uniref:uncharacterized protein LOC128231995 n=1 Tax=Mya arenaria TaxID=6604 RepID=UPI0022E08130|nr:uncharacterized protein LOC128231995 [Mya arenaria]XP_052801273.1 uncharacterized protein LOC128231995 [Mya arenaria]XP_052801274.1 uncharacterized protein LOC128231995 [Mya arenaria]XP_052801275.1 uncharacterized protein LOC128231995 [Mya arenaria]XP_052801276.1 uncharacterized protein LOC128231995 [Mya arenaria]XP_052801277.1 uncharacterized protein LOC128231995 [Mya arenaria]XP_052801278.1 uncharacterized protein LOC128231995 [Mya arenaria]
MMAESLNGEGTMAMPGQGQKTSYTLPAMRYVNIVLTVVFIDGIASVVLWLAGGDSDYFIDSVASFQFKKSVFDLVLLAFLKVSVHAPSIAYLEAIAIQQIDYPYNPRQKTIASLINAVNILISLGGLAFSVTKGSLVLYSVLHDSGYVHMHATYNALLVCAVVLSLIETGLILYSFQAMRRLKLIRIKHLFNDDGVEVDKEGNPVKKAVSIKRLVSLAKPEFPMLLGGTLSLFFSSGTQIVAPLYFGKVVDAAQHSMDELNRTILILLVIYVGGSLFSMARSWLFTLAGQRVVARLRKHLFMSIVQQDVAFFDTNRTGELCNRLSSDTQVLQNAVTVNFSMLARYLLQMIGSLVLMFSLNASLTGVLLSVVPIVSLSAVQYGKFMKKLRQQFQDRLGDAGTQAEESLSSIRTVRTFSAEHKVANLYGADVDKSYQVGKKLAAAGGIFEGGVGMMVAGSIVLVLWYGGKLVHENYQNPGSGVTPGIFTSFLLYTLQVAMAFALMSALYGDFMQAVGASVRIFDLMDRKPKVPNEKGEILAQLDGRIEFKSVDFTYPSRPESKVITNLCLTVEPGEMVALVGPSGGGKSTIVNLIERFYDPDDGYITLGGQDLRDLDPMWFRQKISMVSQEPTLFACSIKDNIAYGRQATLEEVISVAMEANAHEFISSFEEGYETKVGERGVRLSGGQKQRIAIARALIMDPTILLLDEATSALDAESEHLVQEAIDRAMKGRTVVVIAHRLSTVRNASKVVVIDKGVIGEQGTHEELIRKGGVYKRLVLRQLEAGSVVDDLINLEPQSNECPQKTAPLTG